MSDGSGGTSPVILVTGGTGQLGHELVRSLAPHGRVIAPTRAEMDMSDAESIRRYVKGARPTLIVNAAAYTAVDAAESDPRTAFAINAVAPGVLASEAGAVGAALIHYSTDYVFDGRKATPYLESDATHPLSVYGESKLEGERAVTSSGVPHLVLRTSWVYGNHGRNFLRTILSLAREREELRVVDDQVGAPTWSRSIARATATAIENAVASGGVAALRQLQGVYHLTASGATSWYGFAVEALARDPRRAEHRCRVVHAIPSAEYPTPAARPHNSRLDCQRAASVLGIELPRWDDALAEVMAA